MPSPDEQLAAVRETFQAQVRADVMALLDQRAFRLFRVLVTRRVQAAEQMLLSAPAPTDVQAGIYGETMAYRHGFQRGTSAAWAQLEEIFANARDGRPLWPDDDAEFLALYRQLYPPVDPS